MKNQYLLLCLAVVVLGSIPQQSYALSWKTKTLGAFITTGALLTGIRYNHITAIQQENDQLESSTEPVQTNDVPSLHILKNTFSGLTLDLAKIIRNIRKKSRTLIQKATEETLKGLNRDFQLVIADFQYADEKWNKSIKKAEETSTRFVIGIINRAKGFFFAKSKNTGSQLLSDVSDDETDDEREEEIK